MHKKWKISMGLGTSAAVLAGVLATTASAQAPQQAAASGTAAASAAHKAKPTVVLVHGAFEDASSWNGVTRRLQRSGYQVVAPAIPLRGLKPDVSYLDSVLKSIDGPLVLAGHSYGGMLISEAAAHQPRVKALVYSAAFIPKAGESVDKLNGQFPGSLLGPATTKAVKHPGGTDTYVKPSAFRKVFAGDRSAADAAVAAAEQRPVEGSALGDPARSGAPSGVPAYAIVAKDDKAIPAAAEKFEAERAGAKTYSVDAAHDLPASHPSTVAAVIERAALGR